MVNLLDDLVINHFSLEIKPRFKRNSEVPRIRYRRFEISGLKTWLRITISL